MLQSELLYHSLYHYYTISTIP